MGSESDCLLIVSRKSETRLCRPRRNDGVIHKSNEALAAAPAMSAFFRTTRRQLPPSARRQSIANLRLQRKMEATKRVIDRIKRGTSSNAFDGQSNV
jgi:hypothetical protein